MNGTVKWFDAQKGYGFIVADSGEEFFVHYSAINVEGFKTLEENAKVTFEVADNNGKPAAANVTLA